MRLKHNFIGLFLPGVIAVLLCFHSPIDCQAERVVVRTKSEITYLRKKPSGDSEPLMLATAGCPLIVESRENNWYRLITPSGQLMWVNIADVEQAPDDADSPQSCTLFREIPTKPALGILIQSAVIVSACRKDSPAERAGVKEGDVILFVNDQPVSPENFQEIIEKQEIGSMVKMTLFRNGKPTIVEVELGKSYFH